METSHAETSQARCRCGHSRGVHAHYRRGNDCGACGPTVCGSYREAAQANVVHFRQQVVQRLRARGSRPAVPAVPAASAETGASSTG